MKALTEDGEQSEALGECVPTQALGQLTECCSAYTSLCRRGSDYAGEAWRPGRVEKLSTSR